MAPTLIDSHERPTIVTEAYYDESTGYFTIELNGTPVYHTVFPGLSAMVYRFTQMLTETQLLHLITEYDAADDGQRHENMTALEALARAAR